MMPSRQLPLPGSAAAHAQGCTCPDPADAAPPQSAGEIAMDDDCPVHGLAAAERGRIDTEGDIVDKASEPELRRR
jgi:hypothetical protein